MYNPYFGPSLTRIGRFIEIPTVWTRKGVMKGSKREIRYFGIFIGKPERTRMWTVLVLAQEFEFDVKFYHRQMDGKFCDNLLEGFIQNIIIKLEKGNVPENPPYYIFMDILMSWNEFLSYLSAGLFKALTKLSRELIRACS
jgi:hypothetical protein